MSDKQTVTVSVPELLNSLSDEILFAALMRKQSDIRVIEIPLGPLYVFELKKPLPKIFKNFAKEIFPNKFQFSSE